MISFILLYFSLLIIVFPKKDEILDCNFYALIFNSLPLAQVLLGFISLILIALGVSQFPILIISIIVFIISLLKINKSLTKIKEINLFIKRELTKFYTEKSSSNSQKIYLYITFILLIIIFISSFGPINHPDASDYHVGYPYQYFLRGGFFIDGGLHQGLLGIGDYANLSFIQEKNTWLIRVIQIINLPLLVIFISKKFKNNILLITFLSIPTFIQWSTIGKPLFLGESSLVVIYLIWKENKTLFSLKLLLISILSCIGFKLSSLIIIFPLIVDLIFNYSNFSNTNNKIYSVFKYLISERTLLLSILILFSLLLSRFYITGNFAYPLLTNIFNAQDKIVNEFALMIKNYKREDFFFLNIFIPTKLSDLGQVIGPSIILIFSAIFYQNIRSHSLYRNSIFNISTAQLFLLLLFCQGRADYYCAPLILLFSQIKKVEDLLFYSKLRYLFYVSIIFQILIINLFLCFSIFSNLFTILDYTKSMNRFAYGFNITGLIDKKMDGKILINDRNTRLYYPTNYLDIDQMKGCLNDYIYLGENKAKQFCLKKNNVKQILNAWEEDTFNSDKKYKCEKINSLKATRNIFNNRKYDLNYCRLKESSE